MGILPDRDAETLSLPMRDSLNELTKSSDEIYDKELHEMIQLNHLGIEEPAEALTVDFNAKE